MPIRRLVLLALPLLLTTLLISSAEASALEDLLERELRGAWGVMSVEVFSDCSGFYNNNELLTGRVSSKADRRFAPGELVKIDKINLKRSRLDLFLSLAEPILVGRHEGPFELFDERRCKVQMIVDLPHDLGRKGSPEAILEHVSGVCRTSTTLAQAQDNRSWNRRIRRAFPDDYPLTLARYEVWKAEELNAAVAVRAERAGRDAVAVTDRIRHDRSYLAGFASGVEEMRSWDEDDCGVLTSIRFENVIDRPRDKDGQKGWNDGYRDGQELVFNLYLGDLLPGCYVPVPPIPEDLY